MRTARHRPDVHEQGRALVESLGGRWTVRGGLCHCPAHDDRSPSLSIRPGRKRLLFHCFAGCPLGSVLEAIEATGLLRPDHKTDSPGDRPRDPSFLRAAVRIWTEARSIEGTVAAHYLEGRGVRSCSPELRFHPLTPHGSMPLTLHRPALIAAVRDGAGLVGIHRTFLDMSQWDDRQSAPNRRSSLGRLGSGAVRLGGSAQRLGLAEGIETALSASTLFKLPCWATLGTERFGLVSLPADVRELVLFLDHDQGGRRAEYLAREAFGHLRIETYVPPHPGDDWNDVVMRSGSGRNAPPEA